MWASRHHLAAVQPLVSPWSQRWCAQTLRTNSHPSDFFTPAFVFIYSIRFMTQVSFRGCSYHVTQSIFRVIPWSIISFLMISEYFVFSLSLYLSSNSHTTTRYFSIDKNAYNELALSSNSYPFSMPCWEHTFSQVDRLYTHDIVSLITFKYTQEAIYIVYKYHFIYRLFMSPSYSLMLNWRSFNHSRYWLYC